MVREDTNLGFELGNTSSAMVRVFTNHNPHKISMLKRKRRPPFGNRLNTNLTHMKSAFM